MSATAYAESSGIIGNNRATIYYMLQLIDPYVDALNEVTDIQQVREWIPKVFSQTHSDGILYLLKDATLLDYKSFIITSMFGILTAGSYQQDRFKDLEKIIEDPGTKITPWDIAQYKIPEAIRLFGEPTDKIQVTVTIRNNSFIHEMTKELALGILASIGQLNEESENKNLTVAGKYIFVENFDQADAYHQGLNIDQYYKYSINIGYDVESDIDIIHYGFNTTDFMQGLLTGIDWVNWGSKMIYSENFKDNQTGTRLAIQL